MTFIDMPGKANRTTLTECEKPTVVYKITSGGLRKTIEGALVFAFEALSPALRPRSVWVAFSAATQEKGERTLDRIGLTASVPKDVVATIERVLAHRGVQMKRQQRRVHTAGFNPLVRLSEADGLELLTTARAPRNLGKIVRRGRREARVRRCRVPS